MRIFKLSAMDCGGFWPAGKGKHLDTQMFPECKNWPSYQHKGKKKTKKADADEGLRTEAAKLRCSNCGHPVLRRHRSGREGLYECTGCGLAVSTNAIPYEGSWAHSEEVRKREGKPIPGAELRKLPSEGNMGYPPSAK
jgi:predicted RNA-binding Zn-ribbon protein involved in translation (DUF1610 family)